MRYSKEDRATALAKLRELLPPGTTVNCVSRHTSRSGMSRSISLLLPVPGDIYELDYWASRALDERIDQKHGGVVVAGCGMDMGFHLVYSLSRALYPDGFDCIGKVAGRCPSNDHSNGEDVMRHSDGGYALRVRWI